MRSCSHSFNTYLLNTYYVPDTGLCIRERTIMNTDKVSGYILVKGNRKKKTITILYRMVRQGLFDKVKFEHRPEGREGESHMDK